MTRTEKADGWLRWAAAYWIVKRREEAWKCFEETLIHLTPRDEK